MKKDDMIALGLVAVAAYLLLNPKAKAAAVKAVSSFATEINTGGLQQGDAGYGWRYFSDGTSIDPQGNYYKGGQLIWLNPQGLAA